MPDKEPKNDNDLIHLGLMVAIIDVVDFNSDLSLDYKVSLVGKYAISSKKKYEASIVKDNSTDNNKIPVSPFDVNIDANFNLQI